MIQRNEWENRKTLRCEKLKAELSELHMKRDDINNIYARLMDNTDDIEETLKMNVPVSVKSNLQDALAQNQSRLADLSDTMHDCENEIMTLEQEYDDLNSCSYDDEIADSHYDKWKDSRG